jgi:hypothetical protein
MSYSYTTTGTVTFTRTHAQHIAARVAADLKRVQRFYGKPDDTMIDKYEAEIIELMVAGCVQAVTYGFRRGDFWVEPTLYYTARDLYGGASSDDDPGGIRPRADVTGAYFASFLTYSDAWDSLTEAEKSSVRGRLPFQRTTGVEPGIDGYLTPDRSYSAGGRALDRKSVRRYGR